MSDIRVSSPPASSTSSPVWTPSSAGANDTGRAGGLQIHDLWGKDPVTGEIVRSVFDSNGTYGTVRSKGWDRDTLIFEGEATARSGKVSVRETISRVSDDHFNARWEALLDGKWTPYSVEELRRQR